MTLAALAEIDQATPLALTPAALEENLFPIWKDITLEQVRQLLELSPNWDRQGAQAVRRDSAEFAFAVMGRVFDAATPPPQVLPLANGGLQFEWHQNQIDLEWEVTAPYAGYFWFEDHRTGEEMEDELTKDFSALSLALSRLAGP